MSDHSLAAQKCVPCEGNVQPYTPEQIAIYAKQVPSWSVVKGKRLYKEFSFKNFSKAMEFVNSVAAIAESEGHHPDFNIYNWNKVSIIIWTHAIQGLFLNDFILAAKIDKIAI